MISRRQRLACFIVSHESGMTIRKKIVKVVVGKSTVSQRCLTWSREGPDGGGVGSRAA